MPANNLLTLDLFNSNNSPFLSFTFPAVTNGANKVFSDYPKTVHKGRQDKHIVGSNNYILGRSTFSGTPKQAETLIKQHSGTDELFEINYLNLPKSIVCGDIKVL